MVLPSSFHRFFYPHGDLRPKVLLGMIRSQRFIRMRWIIAFALLALYGLERMYRPEFNRPPEVAYCAVCLMLLNLIWSYIGRTLRRLPDVEAEDETRQMRIVWFVNAQMTADLLVLTVLVRFSGGIENPMTIFYLFHMLIAALLLRPLNALLQGCCTLLLFGGVAAGEFSGFLTPHYPFLPYTSAEGPHQDWEHVLVVTTTLAIGILGTLYFTLRISFGLDEQEQRLRAAMDEAHRSRQALQDLQARRARFMRTAAHQLKSPLAGAQTLAGLIADGVVPAEEIPSVSVRIVQRCREGITQVGELLALARIQQADVRTLLGTTCDAGAVVRELVARHTPVAAEMGIAFESDVPADGDFSLHVDAAAVRDCVGNLIENAIKYTLSQGRVAVRVRRGTLHACVPGADRTPEGSMWTRDPGDYLAVSVSDTGMGIDSQSLAGLRTGVVTGSIFDAFLRGNQAVESKIAGSGLGLAIVNEIMEQVGGLIFVHSQLNRGSVFTVAFPVQSTGVADRVFDEARPTIVVLDSIE